jgi:hypothetical protein
MSDDRDPPYCYRCYTNHRPCQACAYIAGETPKFGTDIADPPVYGFTPEKPDERVRNLPARED